MQFEGPSKFGAIVEVIYRQLRENFPRQGEPRTFLTFVAAKMNEAYDRDVGVMDLIAA